MQGDTFSHQTANFYNKRIFLLALSEFSSLRLLIFNTAVTKRPSAAAGAQL